MADDLARWFEDDNRRLNRLWEDYQRQLTRGQHSFTKTAETLAAWKLEDDMRTKMRQEEDRLREQQRKEEDERKGKL